MITIQRGTTSTIAESSRANKKLGTIKQTCTQGYALTTTSLNKNKKGYTACGIDKDKRAKGNIDSNLGAISCIGALMLDKCSSNKMESVSGTARVVDIPMTPKEGKRTRHIENIALAPSCRHLQI